MTLPDDLPFGTDYLEPLPRWVFDDGFGTWTLVWRVSWPGGDLQWPEQYDRDTATVMTSATWGWFSHGPNTTLEEYYESDTLQYVAYSPTAYPFDAGEYDVYTIWASTHPHNKMPPLLPEGMTFLTGDDGGGDDGGGGDGGDHTFDPDGPTTAEFWEVDGAALNTWAWNIESWGGDRRSVPKLRGEDVLIPFRPGERWLPKIAGSRVMTLGMWVLGADADGSVPPEMRGRFNDNWRILQRLFWRTDRQIMLTRRVRNRDGFVVVMDAKAEFYGGLEPSSEVPGRAKFTVDLKLADPYFRPRDDVVRSMLAEASVENPGDDTVLDMVIDFPSSGVLTNETTGLALTVPTAGTIDTGAFTAVKESDGTSMVGGVSTNLQDGALEWMHLRRDVNALTWSGGGSVTITYRPVYL